MQYRGDLRRHDKLKLAQEALSLHESGRKYVEIGALLGFENSRRVAAIKASSLVNYAKRVEAGRARYADHLKNGINDGTLLDAIHMSVRLANAFKNKNIKTIGEARRITDSEFLRIPNIGKVSLAEWKEIIISITPLAL